jgi:ABC-type branched-subunit amino acid transport system permease subunit
MIAMLRANWGLAAVGLLGVALMFILPLALDLFELLQITLYAIFAILALSLAFIWGYGGILCFGHSAFFGLGAYTYAVAVINIGESTAPLLLAMLLPAALAAALGYFMFYAASATSMWASSR